MSEEMKLVVEELEKMHGYNGCDHCPYDNKCDHEGFFWDCPVWEAQGAMTCKQSIFLDIKSF